MTRRPRFASWFRGRRAVLALCLVLAPALVARAAHAGFPSIGCCTVPAHINLVGALASGVDPAGEFTVVVRDLACNPIAGSVVVVEFPAGSDVRLASAPVESGAIVNCATRSIAAVTGVDGIARFRIAGGSQGGPATGAGTNARIYADGVLLTTLAAATFDLDGLGGLGGADFSLWLGDFGAYGGVWNATRSDYDGNQLLGGADLSLWLGVFGAGGSSSSASSYCP